MSYNGWKNWETWVTFTWASNDEDCYQRIRNLVKRGRLNDAINEAIEYAQQKEGSFSASKVSRQELQEAFLEL